MLACWGTALSALAFKLLLSPLGLNFLLGALALVLAYCGWRRLATALAAFGVAWLWCCATPISSHWLRLQAESGYVALDLSIVPVAQAAVVLGGAISAVQAGQPYPDLHEPADRVWHAARLYHAGKVPLLVLSGGSNPELTSQSEAQAMASFLLDLGVPTNAMLLEGRSRNTRENAAFSAELLRSKGIKKVLLVTSAMHMARARSDFKAAGLEVVAVPVDQAPTKGYGSDWQAWFPDAGALDESSRAIKELVGRFAFQYIRGS